jgi:hypothetical protein
MEADKKNRFRFTLQFNENDPHHQRAVSFLNRQNKSISQFIVAAVLHYVDCTAQPISSVLTEQQNEQYIELIVRKTLEAMGRATEDTPRPRPSRHGKLIESRPPEPVIPAPDLSGDDLQLLSGAMQSFGAKK